MYAYAPQPKISSYATASIATGYVVQIDISIEKKLLAPSHELCMKVSFRRMFAVVMEVNCAGYTADFDKDGCSSPQAPIFYLGPPFDL
jgi:hypothetical protein